MRTADEIKEFLAQKFAVEKKRLKSYGTKASSFDLAHAVYRHVEALMCESRYRELKRAFKLADKHKRVLGTEPTYKKYLYYLQERMKATKAMSKAIENVANTNDKNRPWKRTVEKGKNHDERRRSKSGKHSKKS